MAAQFPPEYMGIVMVGNGIAGIMSNISRLITLFIWPANLDPDNGFKGALAAFGFGVSIMILCAICQICLSRDPFVAYYLKRGALTEQESDCPQSIESTEEPPLIQKASTLTTSQSNRSSDKTVTFRELMRQAIQNYSATEGLLIGLTFVFIITFIIFPGLSDDTHFSFLSSIKNEESWYNLLCLVLFNIFDTIGRWYAGHDCLDLSNKSIVVFSALRSLFIVPFLLIAFEVGPGWLFLSDWFKLANFCYFAFTNGHISSLCAIKSPQTVESEYRGQVGSFIGTTIAFGILLGSIFAVGMSRIIELTPEYISDS